MPMGTVVSIDSIRQKRQDGSAGGGSSGGDGPEGLYPAEFRALSEMFELARNAGLVLKMSLQPHGEGFLFRAYSTADPYYTLFEIQKVRSGKIFEYHGRVRHQLVAVGMNFFPFVSAMRAEITRLIDLFGPGAPRF